jgi:hypothetical protein
VLKAKRRLKFPRQGCAHGLSGELIVSLTSYPARFGSLHLTLACLLDQSVKADRTILWIAHQDMGKLPSEVRNLKTRGLEIRACDDLRSFKKLIPTLEAFPDAFIATADDDVYYPRNWLETLVGGVRDGVITCYRAHRILRTADGKLAPYSMWANDVQDRRARQPSIDLLPTGAGGILYPPHSFDQRVTDGSLYERHCPDGDDLWFYWCARLADTQHMKVGPRLRLVTWKGSQLTSLWDSNETGGNDRATAALQSELPLRALAVFPSGDANECVH